MVHNSLADANALSSQLQELLKSVAAGEYHVPTLALEHTVSRLCSDINSVNRLEEPNAYLLFLRSIGLGKNGLSITDGLLSTALGDTLNADSVAEILRPALSVALRRFFESWVAPRCTTTDGTSEAVCDWITARVSFLIDVLNAPATMCGEVHTIEVDVITFEHVLEHHNCQLYRKLGLGYAPFIFERTGKRFFTECQIFECAAFDRAHTRSEYLGVLREYLEQIASSRGIAVNRISWMRELKHEWHQTILASIGTKKNEN